MKTKINGKVEKKISASTFFPINLILTCEKTIKKIPYVNIINLWNF